MTKLAIHTVVPEIKLGEIMISADRRSSKEVKLTDAQRIRRIVLPANFWQGIETSFLTQPSSALHEMLVKSLKELAGERLKEELTESDMLREVDSGKYEISALLVWNKETASNRGMLTLDKDEILSWFEVSKTREAIVTKHGAKANAILQFLRTRFGALAARNHGLQKPEDAAKLMSLIADEDTKGEKANLVSEIMQRLNGIQTSLTAKLASEENISLDSI